jgi:hypothetical protein
MTVLTEGQRAAEFLLTEANGTLSREAGTLVTGQSVVDGQALVDNGSGKLTAATGANSGGTSTETWRGFVIGDHDATAADKKNVPYVARLAEVKATKITKYPGSANTNKTTAINGLMAANFVVAR